MYDNYSSGCIALKAGQYDVASAHFQKLVQQGSEIAGKLEGKGTAEAANEDKGGQQLGEYLHYLERMLTAASRVRSKELFLIWLKLATTQLTGLIDSGKAAANQKELEELLSNICFSVCDKRIAAGRGLLYPVVAAYFLRGTPSSAFYRDWTSLCARMARREWQPETEWLLRLLTKALLHSRSNALLRDLLLQLELHFDLYSRRDGYEAAFKAYKRMQDMYVVLCGRAIKQGEDGIPLLQAVLRSCVGMVSNAARGSMQDELDIFRQWSELLMARAGTNSKLRLKMRVLVQHTLIYWQLTQPKTSRKQMRFLTDLLEPNVVGTEQRRILEKIS